jgi:hypothetical protein
MTPAQAGAALLTATTPSDRALTGWRPPVWLALGTNAILREPFASMGLPCGYAIDWYEQTGGIR